MEFIKSDLLRPGDPTLCAPIDFVKAVRELNPLHQYTTAEEMQSRFTRYFESLWRFEYRVIEDGSLIAMMVITAQDEELETGHIVMFPATAQSLKPGLLSGGYRWLFKLAKEHKAPFVLVTKTKGMVKEERVIPINI